MKNSPISKIVIDTREFFVKRDDLIDPYLAGNKYRKLYTLVKSPKAKYTKIISYGGTQSNAMLALAALCKQKSWEFIYYTKPISATLKNSTDGNYYIALSLGMQHIELEELLYKTVVSQLRVNLEEKTCIVDQGGASLLAEEGLTLLAQEIKEQIAMSSELQNIQAIATPSGTGTTAFFLAKFLPEYRVYTLPCVGDKEYLEEQMKVFGKLPQNLQILNSPKKYHFAKPYREFYTMYEKLKAGGVEFDLLYAPATWMALLEQTKEPLLYVHSGGVSGNSSMRKRYEKKFSL